jgi:hypothetical protein
MTAMKRYNGHFPGHLREDFGNAVDAYESWNDDEPEPTVEEMPISKVFGKLWNCSDILPSGIVSSLENCDVEIKSRTYGAAARALREATKEALRRQERLIPRREETHELTDYDS